MTLILFPILGLILGSFFSVLITRLQTGEAGIIKGRSHCPSCKKTLGPLQLIPILSFLAQKGRCAFCKKAISPWYPALELSTATLFFAVAYLNPGAGLFEMTLMLALGSVWVLIFFYDLKYKAIHDLIVLPGIILAILGSFAWGDPLSSLYGALGGLVFFGGQWLLSRGRWIGSGDIGIGLLMGIQLGWPLLYTGILSGYLLGSCISITLLLTGKATRESQIPLGPFLALGTMLAYLLPLQGLL